MNSDDSRDLTKIHIQVSDDVFGLTGESVWAKPLGNDLYEIRNSLWHSCEINWGDVVRAVPKRVDLKPEFIEVVRRSGHRTIHLLFLQDCPATTKDSILACLTNWNASYENSGGSLYAVDISPDGDFRGLCEFLDEKETTDDKFSYRTIVLPRREDKHTDD